ncbi:MAG: twin-arginine translocase TatA/TatE family subunit [Flavobacteriales bacterium]
MGGKFGIMEIVLILLVVVLLFGGKKIPELMRGLGKGMKEFKDAKDGVEKDGDSK